MNKSKTCTEITRYFERWTLNRVVEADELVDFICLTTENFLMNQVLANNSLAYFPDFSVDLLKTTNTNHKRYANSLKKFREDAEYRLNTILKITGSWLTRHKDLFSVDDIYQIKGEIREYFDSFEKGQIPPKYRIHMEPLMGQSLEVTAEIGKWGKRRTSGEKTVMLRNVCKHGGNFLTNHLWIPDAGPFVDQSFTLGDKVQFCAKVDRYYKLSGLDYCLTRIQQVSLLN